MTSDRDVEFLYEIGSLRFIPRQWKRFLNADFANITEHHFRVMWLALVIAAGEKSADTEKVLKMAMVHDISESRTGDVDYLARQYVVRNEKLGIEDILQDTSLEKEFLKLWHEYEKRETLEAKIVKDADNLDVDLELREQGVKGDTLGEIIKPNREFVYKTKLYTKTAKQLYKKFENAHPHDWHFKGRNRRNAGDWKT